MRNRLSMAALLGAAAMMLSAPASARDLSVISWGGAYQDAQRDVRVHLPELADVGA